MANDYTSSTDAFNDIVEGSYSSSDNPQMATFVTVASRLIDRKVGRWPGFFYPSTADETRYFDGSGEREQQIDEAVSITSVSVAETGGTASSDYTSWGTTDYMVWPYNYSKIGLPIKRLIIDFNGDKGHWYRFHKSVAVAGVFGYSASTPDIIAAATRLQAVRWFMKAKQGYQDTGASVEMGGMKFTSEPQLDPDIAQMLWPYILELSD